MNDLRNASEMSFGDPSAGRPQDLADILFLEELQRPGKLP